MDEKVDLISGLKKSTFWGFISLNICILHIYEVMRILGSSMLVKDNIKDLFSHAEYNILYKNDGQLELDFTS